MDDAIDRYRDASEANDIDALIETIAPDAELVSPHSGRMVFRGRDDLRVLPGAVYATTTELCWKEEVGDGAARVLLGGFKIGPLRAGDAIVFELDTDGVSAGSGRT
jgi:hypothetical protein